MMKKLFRIGVVGLLAVAVAGLPAQLSAQSTNPPAGTNAPAVKKKRPNGFHGKLVAVDKTAMTITVGKTVYQITSKTKIMKDDQPGVLDNGVVGEEVTGSASTDADGKRVANTVYFGKHASKKDDTAPKASTDKS